MDWLPKYSVPWRQWAEHRRQKAVEAATAHYFSAPPAPLYHEDLLGTARQLVSEGRNELAVVVAQMASEVLAAPVLDALMRKKGLAYLEDWIDDRTPSSNLGNETVRKLYVALSDDKIQDQAFWGPYRAHVERRNDIVHRGLRVSKAEAEQSCEVVAQMLTHLAGVLRTL